MPEFMPDDNARIDVYDALRWAGSSDTLASRDDRSAGVIVTLSPMAARFSAEPARECEYRGLLNPDRTRGDWKPGVPKPGVCIPGV